MIPTLIYYCARCGAWIMRIPAHWDGPDGADGDRCDCGSDKFRSEQGRPIGPRSGEYELIKEGMNDPSQ